MRGGVVHLTFPLALCKAQFDRNRFPMFGHPSAATRWFPQVVGDVFKLSGVILKAFDLCAFEMESEDVERKCLAERRARAMTISLELAKGLMNAQRGNDHIHVHFASPRAGSCHQCFAALCGEMCIVANGEVQCRSRGEACTATTNFFMALYKLQRDGQSHVPKGQGYAQRPSHPHDDVE